MSNLVPYERVVLDYGWGESNIHLTGKCKRVTIKDESDNVIAGYECAQVRVKFFGIPLWTRWVNKKDIIWRSKTVEHYECEDLKNG
jgi:hypothetical protein